MTAMTRFADRLLNVDALHACELQRQRNVRQELLKAVKQQSLLKEHYLKEKESLRKYEQRKRKKGLLFSEDRQFSGDSCTRI